MRDSLQAQTTHKSKLKVYHKKKLYNETIVYAYLIQG